MVSPASQPHSSAVEDYASGHSHNETRGGGDELEHLRFAHGVDTTWLEEMHWEDRIRETGAFHGRCHDSRHPEGKGGFPHRHIPEDLTIFTGIRR